MASKAAVEAGQAVYSRPVLSVYDLVVLGFSNRLLWRCPTARIEALYAENVSASHLDVGVGTGYFLDRCRFPTDEPRVGLMDLNPNTLEFAAARIERYSPETYRRDVLGPVEIEGEPFESVGVNYLLHCLPGPLSEKARVFDHLAPLLKAGGVLFGSTLLGRGVPRSVPARALMALYQSRGIFSNQDDTLEALAAALEARFHEVRLETVGCAALFVARKA